MSLPDLIDGQRVVVCRPGRNSKDQSIGDCGTVHEVRPNRSFKVKWDVDTTSVKTQVGWSYSITWIREGYYEIQHPDEWEGELELL